MRANHLHQQIQFLRDRFSYRPPASARFLPQNRTAFPEEQLSSDHHLLDGPTTSRPVEVLAPDVDYARSETSDQASVRRLKRPNDEDGIVPKMYENMPATPSTLLAGSNARSNRGATATPSSRFDDFEFKRTGGERESTVNVESTRQSEVSKPPVSICGRNEDPESRVMLLATCIILNAMLY
ncbi:hypothetical protein BC829DRAFT_241483 [Chytridium lagenaria]|nr:hypothetical protein BC829DRAFT_241483 [Chytridium lagenaria]